MNLRVINLLWLTLVTNWLISQDLLNLSAWEKDSLFNGGIFSYCIKDVESGELLAEYNSGKYLIPASTLKLFTSYAALKILGPGFRFQTRLGTDGSFNADSTELNGNLILEGDGDPTFQSKFFYDEDSLIVRQWVLNLKNKGIRKINGKIVLDMKKFPVTIPENWIWSDLSNAYGAFISPLNYRDNQIRYVFKTSVAGEKSELLGIVPESVLPLMNVKNYVISKGNEDDAYVMGSPFEYRKKIFGKLPVQQHPFFLKGSMPEPWYCIYHDLKNELAKNGIVLSDTIPFFQFHDENIKYQIKQVLVTHFSPTLDKIIKILLTYSHNLYSEAILIAIGKGNLHTGIERIRKFMSEKKWDGYRFQMTDGSGLSRNNLVCTELFTTMLQQLASDKKNYSIIYNSLPVAGKNGTLQKVGKGTALENNLRAKTGYINKVRSFAGYMKTKSGKNIAFSFIINNFDAPFSVAQKKMTDFMLEMYDKF
jgi:D-alanyl-D-alanine carboxypeptidase/D-alanyl-D-alanine-endopeptidase (penicillin-binding protein 4)